MPQEQSSAAPVVLIVENDVLLRLVTASNLRDAGFEVIEAANCAEALRVLDRIPVDVLFSDIDMPGNHWRNGCTGARLIRELYSLRVRRGRQATSRNTRLSFPSPTRRRTLSVSCEAFFLHPRESNRQRGS